MGQMYGKLDTSWHSQLRFSAISVTLDQFTHAF